MEDRGEREGGKERSGGGEGKGEGQHRREGGRREGEERYYVTEYGNHKRERWKRLEIHKRIGPQAHREGAGERLRERKREEGE